jgi:hypothetical protein
VDEGIGAVRRRELLGEEFGIEGLAVEGTKTAHNPKDIFQREGVGRRKRKRLPRQVFGHHTQEPARHQRPSRETEADNERLARENSRSAGIASCRGVSTIRAGGK